MNAGWGEQKNTGLPMEGMFEQMHRGHRICFRIMHQASLLFFSVIQPILLLGKLLQLGTPIFSYLSGLAYFSQTDNLVCQLAFAV